MHRAQFISARVDVREHVLSVCSKDLSLLLHMPAVILVLEKPESSHVD